MDIIRTLKKFISKLGITSEPLDKQRVIELIKTNNEVLVSVLEILNSLSAQEKKALTTKFEALPMSKDKDGAILQNSILKLRNNLQGKAKQLELAYTFGSVEFTLQAYKNMLEEIYKNIDTLITDETTEPSDTRISYVILIGVLKEIEIVINVFKYMHEYFTTCVVKNEAGEVGYKYQAIYVTNNMPLFTKSINVATTNSSSSLLDEIIKARQTQNDPIMCSDTTDCTSSINFSSMSDMSQDRLALGIAGFNIVGGIKRLWNMRQFNYIQGQKVFKASLEAKVALMKLSLAGVSEDSPEYQKLLKMIEVYSDEIAKIDREISKYEGE